MALVVGVPSLLALIALISLGTAAGPAMILGVLLMVAAPVLWAFHLRRRVVIVSHDRISVRDTLGRLHHLRWSEIASSRIGTVVARRYSFRGMRYGDPGIIKVFVASRRRPALEIPLSLYEWDDICFLLGVEEFKYDYDEKSEHLRCLPENRQSV